MKTLGNIIWVVFGGWAVALEYAISSILLMITIIGIPFGLQTFKLAELALWPFGRSTRKKEKRSGIISTIMNIIWFFVGGIWIALTHVGLGIIFFITIIGIPFGKQHFKLAKIALVPFGREIFEKY
ncbi:MAG: YccF domain-containing protein [Prolixibacteraceae bacterium]|nr:YccF domain-containing protein [Prolixibacteraceae bacterium]